MTYKHWKWLCLPDH